MSNRIVRLLVAVIILGVSAPALSAAVLTDAAVKAYAEYVDRARRSFLDRVNQPVGAASGRNDCAARRRKRHPGTAGQSASPLARSRLHSPYDAQGVAECLAR